MLITEITDNFKYKNIYFAINNFSNLNEYLNLLYNLISMDFKIYKGLSILHSHYNSILLKIMNEYNELNNNLINDKNKIRQSLFIKFTKIVDKLLNRNFLNID